MHASWCRQISPNRQVVCRIEQEVVVPTATPDAAAAHPDIRGKARAADREAERERAQDAATDMRLFVAHTG